MKTLLTILTVITLLTSCNKKEETGTLKFEVRNPIGNWYVKINNTLYEFNKEAKIELPTGTYTVTVIGSNTLCASESSFTEVITINSNDTIFTNVHCGSTQLGK